MFNLSFISLLLRWQYNWITPWNQTSDSIWCYNQISQWIFVYAQYTILLTAFQSPISCHTNNLNDCLLATPNRLLTVATFKDILEMGGCYQNDSIQINVQLFSLYLTEFHRKKKTWESLDVGFLHSQSLHALDNNRFLQGILNVIIQIRRNLQGKCGKLSVHRSNSKDFLQISLEDTTLPNG